MVEGYLRGRCLEIGCADGERLARMGAGSIGVDISPRNVAACRSRGLPAQVADANGPLPFANGSFDSVLASHILEHLEAPLAALREMRRVLRPRGTLVLGLPSETHLPLLRR